MDFNSLITYAQGVPPLPENKQKVWNMIGQGKMVMDLSIQKHVLALQGLVADYTNKDQPALAKAMADYKATHKLMVVSRKQFTDFLDDAKGQCMKPEKEWDPEKNETFLSMETLELKLRQDNQKKIDDANAKLLETADFKAHYINEFYSLSADYRNKLATIIHNAYTACLQQRTPVDKCEVAVNAAVSAIRVTKPRDMIKFSRVLLNDQEAKAIFEGIRQPDYTTIFNEAIKSLADKFSMYPEDLANAEQSLAANQQLFTQETEKQAAQDKTEIAANALYVSATTTILTPANGMKGITETTQILIKDQDMDWVAKIMTAFLANFQRCSEKIKVKKKSQLNIAQMAAALDAAGIKVDGVTYETIQN